MNPLTFKVSSVSVQPGRPDMCSVRSDDPTDTFPHVFSAGWLGGHVTIDGTPTDVQGLFGWLAVNANVTVILDPGINSYGRSLKTAFFVTQVPPVETPQQ